MTRRSFYAVWSVIVLLAILVNTTIVLHEVHKASAFETRTCQIQEAGLKAQIHLTDAMMNLGALAALSTKHPALHESLRVQLHAYVAYENAQPKERRC